MFPELFNTTRMIPLSQSKMQISKTSSVVKAALMSVLRSDERQEQLPLVDQHTSLDDLRTLLGDCLISSDKNWKEETLNLIDEVWREEAENAPKVSGSDLQAVSRHNGTNIFLWKGDITQLQGDDLAIVNAGNDAGLGCFQPSHKCIDNIIHRHAGPRLREACKHEMKERCFPLSAGTEPIVTPAFHLPSGYVIHVTGPQVRERNVASLEDRVSLSRAYELSLDAAAEVDSIKSIAFPCISTGLFGFPQEEAAEIALITIHNWLDKNPNKLDAVLLNVFTDMDLQLYQQRIGNHVEQIQAFVAETAYRSKSINLAKKWIDDADAVLICAGAGMSVKEGEMVYTNPADFAKAYPWFTKWGYTTSYEVMALEGDPTVPNTAKWALYAKHMDNMRWAFTPNEGYSVLRKLVEEKDHFILTSNVDACFERSGFDPSRIYTPQGEWTYTQCKNACHHDSVYQSKPMLNNILPAIIGDGLIPQELVPKCPRCGGDMFGNVRAGSNQFPASPLRDPKPGTQKVDGITGQVWYESCNHRNRRRLQHANRDRKSVV